MNRREFAGRLGIGAVAFLVAPRIARAGERDGDAPLPTMTIYKSPTCGCCGLWVKHVEGAGFKTKIVDMDDLTKIKQDAGVPDDLQSCHTALVGKYVVEGHVPADLVKKMLDEKATFTGLAVGGMVVGSPGMEQGSSKQPYSVMAFTRGAGAKVYARR